MPVPYVECRAQRLAGRLVRIGRRLKPSSLSCSTSLRLYPMMSFWCSTTITPSRLQRFTSRWHISSSTFRFVVRLDDTRTWYRYHHLFAGFLQERLRRERPDLTPELHRRAAR